MTDLFSELGNDIYTRLRNDATLKTLVSNPVRLEHLWAVTSEVMPYLVFRLDFPSEENSSVEFAELFIDIFSNKRTGTEALSIRNRLMELLNEKEFSTASISQYMVRKTQMDGFVPEPEEGTYHYVMKFDIRFFK
jgi:hypothetical protein